MRVFSILFVCSGNQCRSPYAQIALSRHAPDWVKVNSAGTLEIEGAPVPPDLIAVANERGFDLSAWLSQPMKGAGANEADLVIGMTLDHVAAAVVDGGADATKTFTLTELVRLLESDDIPPALSVEEAKRAVQLVQNRRETDGSFAPAEAIDDPIGGPKRAYEAMADKLNDLCVRLSRAMGWTDS